MHYYCFWLYYTISSLFMYSVCNPLLCLLDIHLTGTSSPLSLSATSFISCFTLIAGRLCFWVSLPPRCLDCVQLFLVALLCSSLSLPAGAGSGHRVTPCALLDLTAGSLTLKVWYLFLSSASLSDFCICCTNMESASTLFWLRAVASDVDADSHPVCKLHQSVRVDNPCSYEHALHYSRLNKNVIVLIIL